jgi:sugar phosphate permease
MVLILSQGIIIAYIDRANLSVALATPELISAFHLTDSTRGLLNSVFFWSYALLQIPAGWSAAEQLASIWPAQKSDRLSVYQLPRS